MKIIFLIVLFAVFLSPFSIADCFLYQDNNFYCTDLPAELAQSECSFYPDCSPAIHLSAASCQTIQQCRQETSSQETSLPLPKVNQPDSAQGPSAFKGQTKGGVAAEGVSLSDIESGIPGYLWIILSLIVLAAAIYYAITRNLLSPFYRKPAPVVSNKVVSVQDQALERLLWPWETASGNQQAHYFNKQDSLHKNHPWHKQGSSLHQQQHSKKVKDYHLKQFLAESGLALEEKKEDNFNQLIKIHSNYLKRKQKLAAAMSQSQKKIFENLEQLVEFSKQFSLSTDHSFKASEDARKIMAELRSMAFGKKKFLK